MSRSPAQCAAAPAQRASTPALRDQFVRWRWSTQFLHTLGTFGHPIHAWLAALWCLACAGPTAGVELLALPLYFATLCRLPFVWRAARDALTQPVLILLMLWWAWGACSALWTTDRAGAIHELEFIRWAPVVMTLWAILDRRLLLIASICVGYLLANLAQVAEFVALRQGIELFSHPPSPDPLARISAWWHQPAAGGAMLAIAVGLHVGPALFGKAHTRLLGVLGLTASLAGVFATGTRGAMLASLSIIALALLAWMVHVTLRVVRTNTDAARSSKPHAPLRVLALASLALALLAGLAWLGAMHTQTGSNVRERIALAQSELQRALDAKDFDSDMGGRVVAAMAALDMARSRPLHGVGAGSFLDATRAYVQREQLNIQPWRVDKLRTAHNTYLHALATTGLVGLVLLLATLAAGLWGASIELRRSLALGTGLSALGSYASAPLGSLLALALVGCFETIYLNMNTAAMGTTLLALSAWHRFAGTR